MFEATSIGFEANLRTLRLRNNGLAICITNQSVGRLTLFITINNTVSTNFSVILNGFT